MLVNGESLISLIFFLIFSATPSKFLACPIASAKLIALPALSIPANASDTAISDSFTASSILANASINALPAMIIPVPANDEPSTLLNAPSAAEATSVPSLACAIS